MRELTGISDQGTSVRSGQLSAGARPTEANARTLDLRRRIKPAVIFKYAVLCLLVVVVAYPLIWVALAALRTGASIVLHPFSLPGTLHWSNYWDVLVQNGFDIDILNSLWICVLSTVTVTILTAMAAYPLSRMHWKFRKLVIGYFGIGLIVPVYAALIPLYIMLRGVERSVGPQFALAIVYLAVGMPVSTIILISYMSKVPADIEEAAVMDGCSLFGVLWRVILPVVGPGIGVSANVCVHSYVERAALRPGFSQRR